MHWILLQIVREVFIARYRVMIFDLDFERQAEFQYVTTEQISF